MGVRFADQTVELQVHEVSPQGTYAQNSNLWAVGVVKQGHCLLEGLVGEESQARVGDLILMPAGLSIRVLPLPPEGFNLQVLSFAIECVEGGLSLGSRLAFRQSIGKFRGPIVLRADNPIALKLSEFLSVALPRTRVNLRDPGLIASADALLEELRQYFLRIPPAVGETPERIIRVLQTVEDGQMQDLSVAEMARRCGCSRRHLSRVVREHFGSALVSVRTELRLDKAANLLRSKDRKIIDVAMDCGFSHLGLFTSKFRERFGMTPGKWRKQIIVGQEHAIHRSGTQDLPVESVRVRSKRG